MPANSEKFTFERCQGCSRQPSAPCLVWLWHFVEMDTIQRAGAERRLDVPEQIEGTIEMRSSARQQLVESCSNRMAADGCSLPPENLRQVLEAAAVYFGQPGRDSNDLFADSATNQSTPFENSCYKPNDLTGKDGADEGS